MRFRPCIDIHNGKVKQIVGSTLTDRDDEASENFVSERDGAWYAKLYRDMDLKGGHVIMLNPASSSWYEQTRAQAISALAAWPGGLQVGGGINDGNAAFFLEAGASHVIVTSFVFRDGRIDYDNLKRIREAAGRERLVLDLSAGVRDGSYYVVTDRWQKYTDEKLDAHLLERLGEHCSEFLIHGVDAEGKGLGIDTGLVEILAGYEGVPVTYAGGIHSLEDIRAIETAGKGRIDFTVGSALDIFGGRLKLQEVAGASDPGDMAKGK